MHHLTYQLINPPRLAAEGNGFAFVAQFRVNMRLDPNSDWRFFEYRQYIKGNCTYNEGSFSSPHPSRANWASIGLTVNSNSAFKIPGGLTSNYTEDGHVVNGVISRVGYRSNNPVLDLGREDRYLTSQANGRNYQLLDTCGLRSASRQSGRKIMYHLFYEGRIIDTRRSASDQTVLRQRWEIRADDIIV